uniref:Uncharacterized protein n=1 Tax=Lactuca sativa TaxID=4236 RepID=A0A9R1VXY9_LACSA|nr:hypothetical protein LSAT_V11C400225210 [Lactuca sativa]
MFKLAFLALLTARITCFLFFFFPKTDLRSLKGDFLDRLVSSPALSLFFLRADFGSPYGGNRAKYAHVNEMLPFVRSGGFALRKNKETHWMKGWSATRKLKWVDVKKIFYMKKEGRRLRHSMTLTDDERKSSYYMSYQEYVYGKPHSVPSTVRNNFRRQDESSCSVSSSGRLHGRGGRSGKPRSEELAKRLFKLEQ